MINESAELIRKKKIAKERLGYKYIIVDEYQDISRQRYNLIKELS
jgi:DNA helicase-4